MDLVSKYIKSTDIVEGDLDFKQLVGILPTGIVWLGKTLPSKLGRYKLIILETAIDDLTNFEKLEDGRVWKRRKYKVLLTTNVKDEYNIVEWTKWHLDLGFDQIDIYDDLSYVPVSSLVSDDRVNVIRHHAFKSEYMKMSLATAKTGKFDFVMHIDGDEYLYVRDSSIHETLDRFPDNLKALCFHWLHFGSSYLEKADTTTLVKNFTRCSSKLNNHIKTMGRVPCIISAGRAHVYKFDNRRHNIYSTDGCKINRYVSQIDPKSADKESHIGYIAHYSVQTPEHFLRRRVNRKMDTHDIFRENELEFLKDFHEKYNDVENLDLIKRLTKA